MGRRFIGLNTLVLMCAMIAAGPGNAETAGPEQSAPTPEQERMEKQKRLLEAMQTERQNKQKDKQKAEHERQDAAGKCQDSQKLLHSRQNARYLYRQGEDGEKVVFTEEERAQSTAEAEAAVKKWCK
jgi:hypothetical protein